jgi:hypothetical protein
MTIYFIINILQFIAAITGNDSSPLHPLCQSLAQS